MTAAWETSSPGSTPNSLDIQAEAASRKKGLPSFLGYLWKAGSRSASEAALTTKSGVGRSGSPIPKSMMSTPFLATAAFFLSSSAKR